MKYRSNWLLSREEEDYYEKPVHVDLPGMRRTKAKMRFKMSGKIEPPIVEPDSFLTPPPFIKCDCEDGHIRNPRSNDDRYLDKCSKCSHSQLPGWIPLFYTPEKYVNWVRKANNLPHWEFPGDRGVWQIIKNGSETLFFLEPYGDIKNGEGILVVDTEAGRPPENWSAE